MLGFEWPLSLVWIYPSVMILSRTLHLLPPQSRVLTLQTLPKSLLPNVFFHLHSASLSTLVASPRLAPLPAPAFPPLCGDRLGQPQPRLKELLTRPEAPVCCRLMKWFAAGCGYTSRSLVGFPLSCLFFSTAAGDVSFVFCPRCWFE